MVAKLFRSEILNFRARRGRRAKCFEAVAGLRPQNILLVFLASLENLKFRYEIVLQPSHYILFQKVNRGISKLIWLVFRVDETAIFRYDKFIC